MTKKIILSIVIIVSIIIIGYLQLSSKLQPTNQEINYDYTGGDLSYSIADLGEKEEYFKITSISSNSVSFEANFESGACNKYKCKYIKDNNNLKIILTDLDECMWHLTFYGVKGEICNLEKGRYDIILGVDSGKDNIKEIFKENIEIK